MAQTRAEFIKPSKSKTAKHYVIDRDGYQKIPSRVVINWNEGMLKQVKGIGTDYHAWIDHPRLEKVRMFDSTILESFSFTPWWVVGCLYIPWGIMEARLGYYDLQKRNDESSVIFNFLQDNLHISTLLITMCLFTLGAFAWTLFEYFCHRYAFHWDPPSPKWNLLHFVGHGMHHLTPADDMRLVFPPAISVPLCVIVRQIFYSLLLQLGVCSCMMGGFMVGYALYESIHYLAHHWPFCQYLQDRFKHHSAHHFNPHKQQSLYGVSSQIWDVVFGTM